MNAELALLNKNLTDAKKDLITARLAFDATDSDDAYTAVRACYDEIAKIQDQIITYLLTNK